MDIREWRGGERLAQEEPVASLLRAAAAPSEPGPQPGEEAALAAFRATRQTIGRTPMRSTKMKAAFAAAVSAGVLLTGGVAAAAVTGTLPGAAQFGFDTPDHAVGGEHANSHASDRGVSADHVDSDETTEPTDEAGTDEKADEDAAVTDSTSTDSTSAEDSTDDATAPEHPDNHGAAVSQAARDNAGQAHAKSGDSTEGKPAEPGSQRSKTGATASSAKGENGARGTARNDAQDPADGAGAQTTR
jgi:lysozyme